MTFLHSFTLPDFLDPMVSLFAAFVLGTVIGAERNWSLKVDGAQP